MSSNKTYYNRQTEALESELLELLKDEGQLVQIQLEF